MTDGEFGRSMWHLDFLWGFDGIERYIAEHGYPFKDHDGQILKHVRILDCVLLLHFLQKSPFH